MTFLDGRQASSFVYSIMQREAESKNLKPSLRIILVGNDPASAVYVKQKIKKARELGFDAAVLHFSESVTLDELIDTIKRLNEDSCVDGYIIQLPLPPHLEKCRHLLLQHIDPMKDVDGFSPRNLGGLVGGSGSIVPATPAGIILLMAHYDVIAEGKRVVVVGRSPTVGMPLAVLLASKKPYGNATVTICHSWTEDLPSITRCADILVSAVGKPGLITARHVRKGVVIVDVGINFVNGRICGDVDTESLSSCQVTVTPVPGGVGPMTVCSLLLNTLVVSYLRKQGRTGVPEGYFFTFFKEKSLEALLE